MEETKRPILFATVMAADDNTLNQIRKVRVFCILIVNIITSFGGVGVIIYHTETIFYSQFFPIIGNHTVSMNLTGKHGTYYIHSTSS
jgi:hypothetical protein